LPSGDDKASRTFRRLNNDHADLLHERARSPTGRLISADVFPVTAGNTALRLTLLAVRDRLLSRRMLLPICSLALTSSSPHDAVPCTCCTLSKMRGAKPRHRPSCSPGSTRCLFSRVCSFCEVNLLASSFKPSMSIQSFFCATHPKTIHVWLNFYASFGIILSGCGKLASSLSGDTLTGDTFVGIDHRHSCCRKLTAACSRML